MFANFALSSGGLVDADVKPKRTRTDLGCLPCRRKKKKCDLFKPTCLRCQKSTGAFVCEWPANTTSPSSSEDGKQAQDTPTPLRGSEEDAESTSDIPIRTSFARRRKSVLPITTNSKSSELIWKPPSSRLGSIIKITLPIGVKKITPGLSSSDLIQLTTAFDKALISGDKTLKQPVSSLCLPLCLDHPGLMHAWLSCSTAFLVRGQPGGWQRALLHYQHAVKGLSTAIRETGVTSAEWKLAAILLLHTFECIGPGKGEDASIHMAHLNGAHNIVRYGMMSRPPASVHELLVLEAYVYRTTINRLFQPFHVLPFGFVERLYKAMSSAGSPRTDMIASWRSSPWIGMSADLFDIAFKLSWLRERVPLRGNDLVEALALFNRLATWEPPVGTREEAFDIDVATTDPPMMRSLQSAMAWWYGCLVLSQKILNPSISPLDPELNVLSRLGRKPLQKLANMNSASSQVLWPTILLGVCAITPDERGEITDIISDCAAKSSPGSIERVTQFMSKAWAPDPELEAGFLGSDILFRDDLLGKVYM